MSLLGCASLHLLMHPLFCMHIQYMHNMSFGGTLSSTVLCSIMSMTQCHNDLALGTLDINFKKIHRTYNVDC